MSYCLLRFSLFFFTPAKQYVQGVKNNVLNTNARKERELEEKRKQQKAEQKMRKKAMEEERNLLFNEALGALKKKGPNFKEGKSAAEAKGRDHDDGTEKKGTSRAMKMMYQMDAKEMEQRLKEDPNYVPTLEDKIEAERQQKVEELKKCTTPTLTNLKWQTGQATPNC